MTTVGFNLDDGFDPARVQDFMYHVDRVRADFSTATGNVLALTMASRDMQSGVDGPTFSVWRNNDALRDAVFRPGIHREQLDRYKVEHTADRTSFTRLSLRISAGHWSGVDPFEGQAEGRKAER